MKYCLIKHRLAALMAVATFAFASGCSTGPVAEPKEDLRPSGEVAGHVLGAGSPIAGATVTLYAAGEGAPTQLAQSKTDGNGAFTLNAQHASGDAVLYLIAKGGTPKAAANNSTNDAIALMALLGSSYPKTVTVNELTTVASAFTAARFINGEAISGNCLLYTSPSPRDTR